jgi:hypothetical protein
LARAILQSKRYHLSAPHVAQRPKTWLQIAFDWARDVYDRLLRALTAHVHVSHAAGVVFGGVIVVALLALLLVVVLRLTGVLVPEKRNAIARAATAGGAADARGLYDRSVRAAAEGDFERAVVLLFAATLAGLSGRGIVRDDASATVEEFSRALRANDPARASQFESIAQPFTAVAYAERAVGASEWSNAHAAFSELLGPVRDAA